MWSLIASIPVYSCTKGVRLNMLDHSVSLMFLHRGAIRPVRLNKLSEGYGGTTEYDHY